MIRRLAIPEPMPTLALVESPLLECMTGIGLEVGSGTRVGSVVDGVLVLHRLRRQD